MGIHKGTKLTDTPKDAYIKIRADQQTREQLDLCCKKLGKTKSEIIRMGIERIWESVIE